MTEGDHRKELNLRLDIANDEAMGMPNGAWQAYMETTVAMYNHEFGTKFDPFTEWLGWVERQPQAE